MVFLQKDILKNIPKMAQKRASDALVAMDMKRARNELVAVTNRDKALLEAVSKICIHDFPKKLFLIAFKT